MPIDSIITVTGTGDAATTTNDVAAVDMPEDGLIVGIDAHVHGENMASEDFAEVQLSFLSTNQFGVNDSRATIATIGCRTGLISTEGQANSYNSQFLPINEGIPVAAGERIHLHTTATTGVTPVGRFTLYLVFTPGTGRRSQRRR